MRRLRHLHGRRTGRRSAFSVRLSELADGIDRMTLRRNWRGLHCREAAEAAVKSHFGSRSTSNPQILR